MNISSESWSVINLNESHIPSTAKLEAICFSCPWTEEQFIQSLHDPYTELYGICNKDKVIAYLLCSVIGDYAEILNIATHPDFRRKGLAQKLLCYWINQKHIQKIQIVLEVRSKNIPAQNLYTKFGFKQIHIRKNYYQDDDALVMQR